MIWKEGNCQLTEKKKENETAKSIPCLWKSCQNCGKDYRTCQDEKKRLTWSLYNKFFRPSVKYFNLALDSFGSLLILFEQRMGADAFSYSFNLYLLGKLSYINLNGFQEKEQRSDEITMSLKRFGDKMVLVSVLVGFSGQKPSFIFFLGCVNYSEGLG